MPASATKSKADSRTAKDQESKAAKAKEKEKAAKAKEKEKAARAKEKEKAARAKEKEKAVNAKEKEREAKRKEKEREARAKEKEKAARAKEKEKAAKAKDKEREAKRKEKEREARRKEKEKAARAGTGKRQGGRKAAAGEDRPATRGDGQEAGSSGEVVQPVEEVAVPERGDADEVPAAAGGHSDDTAAPGRPADRVGPAPEEDTTVRPKGWVAEVLGKEDAVERSTQRPTVAASYTTRDHDVIEAWATSRGGRPADVEGTGDRGAGVLRIEFPDGPGDDSRLEEVAWTAFFAAFDDSDVDFLYQERVRTGAISRFHKFVRAGE